MCYHNFFIIFGSKHLENFSVTYIKGQMGDKNSPKFSKVNNCNFCDYSCCKKSDFSKHLLSSKHQKKVKMMTDDDNNGDIKVEKIAEPTFTCECGKEYKHRQGLSRHKKTCNSQEPSNTLPLDMSYNLILEIVKQNQEFKELLIEQNKENQKLQQQILEMAKEGKIINNTTNTTNNTNNFNLQFFLNEQCKDALNIMDFINQLKLNTTDLDMVGRVGYSEGISKLFIRGLKELDVFKRPVHCSDLKREVLYVKDKDSWEKDNDEKNKMKTAIKYIAAKNFKQIKEWREKNPESDDYDSQRHMDYHQIVIHSMGGSTKEEDEQHYNKIIRNVAKESVIDKSISK
jgi:hypothetical protein